MEVLVSVAIILFFGLIFGKLIKYIKLPEVTGYLLAGIVIGPCVLKFISFEQINYLETFSTIALAFISFLIGVEFKWKYVKKLGKKPFIIGIIASLFTMVLVGYGTLLLGFSPSFALILGAIASSTAPAAILMIVKEYKAKGEVTNTMLSVVAIDDIISIVLFGFALAVAEYTNNSDSLISLLNPFKEIILSIAIGSIIGLLLGFISKLFKNSTDIISFIIVFLFAMIIICDFVAISPLLTAMVMGIVFINAFDHKTTEKVLDMIDYISPPILIIFFVLSGASLDFKMLPSIGIIGIAFIILRSIGKILGTLLGAKIVNSTPKVTRYLGLTLLSQTGLAIGLATMGANVLKSEATILMTIIIASSFIFDIFSPILVKISLKKVKEIR